MLEVLLWICAGFGLILLELWVSGFILVFVGISALIVGIAIASGFPTTGAWVWTLFSVLTLVQIFGLRKAFKKWFIGDVVDGEQAGIDGDFIGKMVEVVGGFQTEHQNSWKYMGRVHFRGTEWDAVSEESFTVGQPALITGRKGMRLVIRGV